MATPPTISSFNLLSSFLFPSTVNKDWCEVSVHTVQDFETVVINFVKHYSWKNLLNFLPHKYFNVYSSHGHGNTLLKL